MKNILRVTWDKMKRVEVRPSVTVSLIFQVKYTKIKSIDIDEFIETVVCWCH